MLSDWRVGNK